MSTSSLFVNLLHLGCQAFQQSRSSSQSNKRAQAYKISDLVGIVYDASRMEDFDVRKIEPEKCVLILRGEMCVVKRRGDRVSVSSAFQCQRPCDEHSIVQFLEERNRCDGQGDWSWGGDDGEFWIVYSSSVLMKTLDGESMVEAMKHVVIDVVSMKTALVRCGVEIV